MTSVLRDLHRRHAAARRRGAAPALPLDPAREPAAAAPDDAEERALLAAALDELARQDRRAARVLALRHAAGLTWAEIASAAGTSVTTVRRDAAFALAWLRRELRRQGLPISQEHRER